MAKFKLLVGNHVEEVRRTPAGEMIRATKGDIVESSHDLCALFENKFARVSDDGEIQDEAETSEDVSDLFKSDMEGLDVTVTKSGREYAIVSDGEVYATSTRKTDIRAYLAELAAEVTDDE